MAFHMVYGRLRCGMALKENASKNSQGFLDEIKSIKSSYVLVRDLGNDVTVMWNGRFCGMK